LAQDLYEQFIKPGADMELGVQAQDRSAIAAAIKHRADGGASVKPLTPPLPSPTTPPLSPTITRPTDYQTLPPPPPEFALIGGLPAPPFVPPKPPPAGSPEAAAAAAAASVGQGASAAVAAAARKLAAPREVNTLLFDELQKRYIGTMRVDLLPKYLTTLPPTTSKK
jgi:hypothetical protein